MSAPIAAVDFAGHVVTVGSAVRVRGITSLRGLSRSERQRAKSMIGEVFTVEEVDSAGLAWVTRLWDLGDGKYDAHGVGLSASEMELVGEGSAA